ncbi:MFS transporter [Agrococcus sp. SGAir0287]|uniref:MFS transporter n=1 Tax=Agrococcus sp. SGAir0287 TaxID=2070347 RepID=UPI0010CCB782|nr:MFS transporter [Agrococcus sp. SGAir0287]QCR19950.1 MFS transporter [Agrococcus sp. SGAir0287]
MTTPRETPATFPLVALLTLAFAIFVNISVEMLPMGLLLPMSRDLGVGEGAIGLLVTVFAGTVVLTSTVLVHLTRRIPRHVLVVTVLVVFGITCIATAAVPEYWMVVVLRVVAGLAHGVFWTVVGAYAAYLVPKEELGRAVGITSAGGSLAFVLGLPLSTLLGQALGWRWSFAVFGVACLVAAALVRRMLPAVQHLPAVATTETGSVALPQREPGRSAIGVAVAVSVTAVVMLGQYAFYTYVTPYMVERVGLPEIWLSPALLSYGLMGALAVAVVSVWLGRRPFGGAVGCMVVMVVVCVVLASTDVLPVAFAAILLWGLAMGALPPLLQTRMLQASPTHMLQTSTAWYTSGFNLGIGGGALLGALVYEGAGIEALPAVLLVALVVGLVLVLADGARLARVRRAHEVR